MNRHPDRIEKPPGFELLRQKVDRALKGQASRAAQVAGEDQELADEVRLTHQEVRRLERHLAALEAMVATDGKRIEVVSEDAGASAVLSGREQEVVRRIAQGQTVAQVAGALCRSKKTIWELRRRALRKLELKTDAELGRYAQTQGWV